MRVMGGIVKWTLFCVIVGAIGLAFHLWHLSDTPLPRGILATVNGEQISLGRVQLVVDGQQMLGATSSFDDMRGAYARALQCLIVTRLMERELAKNGLLPDRETIDAASRQYLADYTPEELQKTLGESGVSEEDWLELMRDRHIAILFGQHILLDRLHIPLGEIRAYYQQNKEQFTAPDRYGLCNVLHADKARLEAFCAALGKGESASATEPPLHASCMDVRRDELPDALQALAKKGRTGVCAPLERADEFWLAAWLAPMHKAREIPLHEAWPVIEALLRDSEKYQAFADWLALALARADIRLAPEIAPALLNLQQGEKKVSNPVADNAREKAEK